ncbi:MAG: DUF3352 domain-containing protein [Anaerolineales bacterium]
MLLIGGAVVVGIIVLFLLTQRKPADSMASFMPANTAMYFHVDLNELTSEEMQEITAAFQTASGEEVTEGEPGAFQLQIEGALGLDYAEHIEPWLGSQLGAGVLDMSADSLSGGDMDGNFIVVIESRDAAAADAFLDELAASAEQDGHTVTSSEVQGVRFIEMGADSDIPAAAQGKGVVMFADSAATIENALVLKAGDSLGSLPDFSQTVGDLAAGRLATVYLNLAELPQDLGDVTSGITDAYASALESASVALGASIVPAGIQLEYVLNVDEAQLPAATLATLKAASEPITTIERYPEDTILFLGTNTTGFSPEAMREGMGEEAYQDYVESIDALSATAGIDFGNLLSALDGEFSLGVFGQQTGVGAFTGGFGLQILVTTSQDAALASFFAELTPLVGEQMDVVPEPRTIANMASYVVPSPFGGELLAYGSGSGLGYLTTNAELVEASQDPGFTSFADSDAFQRIRDAVGSNGHPVFYLDLTALLTLAQTAGMAADELSAISPLTSIAGAVEPFQNGTLRGVFIAFIDR